MAEQTESPMHKLKDVALSFGFTRFVFLGITTQGVGSISFGLDDQEERISFVERFLPVLVESDSACKIVQDIAELCLWLLDATEASRQGLRDELGIDLSD